MLIDKLNTKASSWESSHPEIAAFFARLASMQLNVPNWLHPAIACVLLAYSAVVFIESFAPHGGIGDAYRAAMALALTGLAVFGYKHLVRISDEMSAEPTVRQQSEPTVRLLGYDINFAVIQILTMAVLLRVRELMGLPGASTRHYLAAYHRAKGALTIREIRPHLEGAFL